MSYRSATDNEFLGTLDEWLQKEREVLMLIRYSHMAGAKDFEFYSSFDSLVERLNGLPPRACVIVFRQPQLPIRGIVDDGFIAACLNGIPDGSEYLLAETTRRIDGWNSGFYHRTGETHEELREDLDDWRGSAVAAGLYPPWLEDTADVISAVVPDEHGVVTTGVY